MSLSMYIPRDLENPGASRVRSLHALRLRKLHKTDKHAKPEVMNTGLIVGKLSNFFHVLLLSSDSCTIASCKLIRIDVLP
jgi:hypothetical protein